MNRRSFVATAAASTGALAFPAVLRAQAKDPIRVGFPVPLAGTLAALANDLQRGGMLDMEEINARGGIMGRKLEVLFRDDRSSRRSAPSGRRS